MLATRACPSMIEWFAAGTEPRQPDTWQIAGRITLPAQYAEWTAANERREQLAAHSDAADQPQHRARILSPLDGDRYERPVGGDPRYHTIPLLATSAQQVRWSVNGRPLDNSRWQIAKGTHVIEASWPGGVRDSVTIIVQ